MARRDYSEGSFIPYGISWGLITSWPSGVALERYFSVHIPLWAERIGRSVYSGRICRQRRVFILHFAFGIRRRFDCTLYWSDQAE